MSAKENAARDWNPKAATLEAHRQFTTDLLWSLSALNVGELWRGGTDVPRVVAASVLCLAALLVLGLVL